MDKQLKDVYVKRAGREYVVIAHYKIEDKDGWYTDSERITFSSLHKACEKMIELFQTA